MKKSKSFKEVVSTEPTLSELMNSIDLKTFRPKINDTDDVIGLSINKNYVGIKKDDALPKEECKAGAYASYIISKSESTGKLWLNPPAVDTAKGWF